jgi:hypothetical protein
MRIFILLTGVIIGGGALGLGWQAMHHAQDRLGVAVVLEKDIERAAGEIRKLEHLAQSPAVFLPDAYAQTVNDMRVLAQAHHLSAVVGMDGHEADIEKNAVPATFRGLRQVPVQVSFAGVARQAQFLAFLEGLSSVEKTDPVLVSEVRFKKDAVSVELAVIGL